MYYQYLVASYSLVKGQVFRRHYYTHKILMTNPNSISYANYLGRLTFSMAIENLYPSQNFIRCEPDAETLYWPFYMHNICNTTDFDNFWAVSGSIDFPPGDAGSILIMQYYFKKQLCSQSLTLLEKCKFIHFTELIFNLESYDHLIRSRNAFDLLANEIVFDFIYGTSNITQQLENYGPYFPDILNYATFDMFKMQANRLMQIMPQIMNNTDLAAQMNNLMQPGKTSLQDFSDITLTLNDLRKYLTEGTKKAAWMSQVTNIDVKDIDST